MSSSSSVVVPAPSRPQTSPATIIFLHGLGDDANGWTDLVTQIHAANKLPHCEWILPNAPQNRDAMGQAWFTPKAFSPIPLPKRSGEIEEAEDDDDDEDGMIKSMESIGELIDQEVERGIPTDRIVVGGFSQGCAIALLVGLLSKHRDKLGGVVGLSGFMPLRKRICKIREEGRKGMTRWFLAHGSKDPLVPKRIFSSYAEDLEGWDRGNVEVKIYEGMGHSTSGPELRDLCSWLERVVPDC